MGVTVEDLITGRSSPVSAEDARDIKIRELIHIVRDMDREEYEAVLFLAKTIKKLQTRKRS
ncbi:MAG: hypothetical protein LBK13_02535 [Spirochaetales bacterium]|nr:hypothetical protein [Spirochaetales bacterium]